MIARHRKLLLAILTVACTFACHGSRQHETEHLLATSEGGMLQTPDSVPLEPESEDEWTPEWIRAQVRVGGAFFGNFRTQFRLDSENTGLGTKVGFEDDLGFDTTARAGRIDAFYRFNRRHRVDFSYFDIRRDATRTLDRELEWGDVTFPINARVASRVDTQIIKASYGYTILPEDDWELAMTVGVHGVRLGVGVEGNISGGPGGGTAVSRGAEFDTILPLPVVGMTGEWVLGRRWRITASTQWFYVKLGVKGLNLGELPDEFEGFITDNTITLEWDTFQYMGLGLGYNYFYLNASIGDDLLKLSGEYSYHGVMLYARVFF